MSKISRTWLVYVAEQAGLRLIWSEIPEDRFSHDVAHLIRCDFILFHFQSKTRPTPANVWNSTRREKFKHLTDNTPCSCGAGK